MQGIFIRFTASGYETIRCDESGHFPMDFHRYQSQALRYGETMAKQFKLPLFMEQPV